MAKLTKRTVESLAPTDRDFLVFDDELPGFGVRVMPSGRKTFLVQYRAKGRTRRVKIGTFGALAPEAARTEAKKLLGDIARGENPAEDIAHDRRAPTLAAMCDRFMDQHAAIRCKPRTQHDYRKIIDRVIRPKLGTRKIGDITRSDIARLHHDMRDRPYMANRTLALLSKLFNLTELWGLRPDGSNPCRHVSKYREVQRERFLSHTELTCLGKVLEKCERKGLETQSAINAIRLLILTGCRLSEIQFLKWEHVQPPYLVLPDTKTGARKIPIDNAVADVLASIERAPGNPYVIAGKVPGQPLSDLRHPWGRIRERAKLEDVRIHDLRHTYASHALEAGLSLEMVGKLLGHTQMQTTMRYAHLADEPIRDAARMVGGNVANLLSANRKRDEKNVAVLKRQSA